ncbi:MAG: hypothetical protein HRU13_02230 [Phycisphaerales bacterium]|nr:hypothetical protein [Phycisphaerales bacterium]
MSTEQAQERLKSIWELIDELPKETRHDMRAFFRARAERNFRTEGAFEGKKWAAYEREPRYRAFKIALTGGENLLRWPGSDRIYKSLTQPSSENVFRIHNKKIRFGSRVPWARSIREGGTNPFGERFPGRAITTLGRPGRRRLAALLTDVYLGNDPSPSQWRQT